MKKRVQCLLLALVLLATAFCVSCGNEDELDSSISMNQGSTKSHAMTLTLWGIRGENTTDEAIELVEKAMSAVTRSEFNTNLELNLLPKDEYNTIIEARIAEAQKQIEIAEAEADKMSAIEMLRGEKFDDDEETTIPEDITSINEIGLVETIYPESDKGQLDIFYIPDYDKYIEYRDAGYLAELSEQMNSTGKLMKTYIHPNILNATAEMGANYAVINNKPVGQYTYLLLNNALLDKYYYDAAEITQFAMADEFIMDIGANDQGVVPVYKDFEVIGAEYFTKDGAKSIVGAVQPASAVKNKRAYSPPRIIFGANDFVSHVKQMKKYQALGYVGDGTADIGKFAVGVIRGSVADVEKYSEQYTVHVLQTPYVTNEIFNDMFAISAYTKDLKRSMEILTALNTNSTLRNIFGYGIEGTHFKLDTDGVVIKLNNDYDVPLEATGNMFIAYPPEGSYPTIWEDCKKQNLEIKDYPYFGFMYEDVVDPELMQGVADISGKYFDEMDKVSYTELDAWIAKTVEELKENETVSKYTSFAELNGLAFQYNEWFFALFPDAML